MFLNDIEMFDGLVKDEGSSVIIIKRITQGFKIAKKYDQGFSIQTKNKLPQIRWGDWQKRGANCRTAFRGENCGFSKLSNLC